jgi:hypothetical protein
MIGEKLESGGIMKENKAIALRCRCGADGSPIRCVGGCEYLCQRLAEKKAEKTQ